MNSDKSPAESQFTYIHNTHSAGECIFENAVRMHQCWDISHHSISLHSLLHHSYISIHLLSICLCICPFDHPSIYLSIYQSVHISNYLSIHVPVYQFLVFPSIHPSVVFMGRIILGLLFWKFATPFSCVSLLITPDRHHKLVTRIRILFTIVGHEDGCC